MKPLMIIWRFLQILNYQNILKQENVEMILTKFSWNGIPTTLLLDKNYKILESYSGPITYDVISAYSD